MIMIKIWFYSRINIKCYLKVKATKINIQLLPRMFYKIWSQRKRTISCKSFDQQKQLKLRHFGAYFIPAVQPLPQPLFKSLSRTVGVHCLPLLLNCIELESSQVLEQNSLCVCTAVEAVLKACASRFYSVCVC